LRALPGFKDIYGQGLTGDKVIKGRRRTEEEGGGREEEEGGVVWLCPPFSIFFDT